MIPSDIRLRSRVLRDLVTIVFVLLLLALGLIWFGTLANGGPPAVLVYQLPLLFYLLAIWMVRQALAAMARGDAVEGVVARLLARIGGALVLGALTNVFLVQWLLRLSFGPRHGSFAMFDPAAITLGVIGFTLLLVAQLLVSAAEMRAELDEIL